ncbi:Na(+)/H(+) antiporter subunit C [Ornithinicoccus hortensis]|uniref:Multisubunit sodium/proton antiporter MrpC subunit n=1 Tax=Ornithinicoccus hortensis TaxID=82346 RepID=A0A542YMW2_9MICO|nr:Na(+)/H(+) antiporter subunit C [Ornithinicoccus hortensis]TQL49381.1 multisubunit sodium/proton antiporter MrpC subunit [Ornithinicoccus hortensis]
MTPNLTYVLLASGMIGCGVYLLLARSIVRALVGVVLMGNGINILFLVASGPAGEVPILGEGDGGAIADPVPQAMVLTAIVITLGMTAFVLALAHRSWQLDRSDLYSDDPESSRIHQMAESNDMSGSPSAEEAAATIAVDVVESESEDSELEPDYDAEVGAEGRAERGES